jgi:hypothetical protein
MIILTQSELEYGEEDVLTLAGVVKDLGARHFVSTLFPITNLARLQMDKS